MVKCCDRLHWCVCSATKLRVGEGGGGGDKEKDTNG